MNNIFEKTNISTENKISKLLPIYKVKTNEKKIALTFNVAWDKTNADDIINILNEYNIKSTFFIVGEFVDEFPLEVKKISDSGNEIGNHSNKHPHVLKLNSEEITEDLKSGEEKILKITGKKTNLYRAPYGEYNNKVIETIEKSNYKIIQWSIDSLDWKNLLPEKITNSVIEKAKQGDIILFHAGKENTIAALPDIIKTLQEKGFKLTTISDLIFNDNYIIDNEGIQKKNS